MSDKKIGDGICTSQLDILSLNSSDPFIEITQERETYYVGNEEINLTYWEFMAFSNTVLQIKVDNQTLQAGEEITLVFCFPSENANLQGSNITRYQVHFILKDIIVQESF